MSEGSAPMTTQEVADFLGISTKAVYMAVYRGALRKTRTGRSGATFDRADVETYLARRWRPDQPDPDPYWIDLAETAQLLGTSRQWARTLAHRGRLPTPTRHPTGRLLFRRQQIQVIANARNPPITAGGTRRAMIRLLPHHCRRDAVGADDHKEGLTGQSSTGTGLLDSLPTTGGPSASVPTRGQRGG